MKTRKRTVPREVVKAIIAHLEKTGQQLTAYTLSRFLNPNPESEVKTVPRVHIGTVQFNPATGELLDESPTPQEAVSADDALREWFSAQRHMVTDAEKMAAMVLYSSGHASRDAEVAAARSLRQIVDIIDDLELNVFWNDGKALLNCNDVFFWGCADCEEITVEDIPALRKAHEDSKCHNGEILFIARKRGERPQGAYYACIEPDEWPLLDACGPDRPADLGNPVASNQESVKAHIVEKAKDKEAAKKFNFELQEEIATLRASLTAARTLADDLAGALADMGEWFGDHHVHFVDERPSVKVSKFLAPFLARYRAQKEAR